MRKMFLTACACALLFLAIDIRPNVAGTGSTGDAHLIMGNPSDATEDPSAMDNFLMKKPKFALSYNNSKGRPNWVSWRLKKGDFGQAPRKPFHPDDTLPPKFHRVKPSDYRFAVTAMSRGHMCPRSDRNDTAENSRSTFVMTNMVPQTEELNGGAWNDMENACRDLVSGDDRELYIVAGPVEKGGHSSRGFFTTTDGTVEVPARCWKVVLVLDSGSTDALTRVNDSTRVLAVVMPNDQSPKNKKWTEYRVKLTDVEALTNYKFFDKAPSPVMTKLRLMTALAASQLD